MSWRKAPLRQKIVNEAELHEGCISLCEIPLFLRLNCVNLVQKRRYCSSVWHMYQSFQFTVVLSYYQEQHGFNFRIPPGRSVETCLRLPASLRNDTSDRDTSRHDSLGKAPLQTLPHLKYSLQGLQVYSSIGQASSARQSASPMLMKH